MHNENNRIFNNILLSKSLSALAAMQLYTWIKITGKPSAISLLNQGCKFHTAQKILVSGTNLRISVLTRQPSKSNAAIFSDACSFSV
jgi:hypothetical protein